MIAFEQVLTFSAGTFCLGAACILGLIAGAVARHSIDGQEQGCSHLVPVLLMLGLAIYFFIRAVA